MPDPFTLDPQLAADTTDVFAMPLCDVRLAKDARFPWLILIPRRSGMADIIDLEAEDRQALLDDVVRASEALKAVTGCDKLNVAALGNQVRQLHVHVIARFEADPAWPGPIWGSGEVVAYDPAERDNLAKQIRDILRP